MTENWKQFEGQFVDGFQLEEYLGSSASAGVFLTAQGDTKLAIKVMDSDAPASAERLDYWRAAQGLSHSHLLRVVGSGQAELDGMLVLYVVMEYAEENLSQILPQRPLTVDEVREMLPTVLDALDYLHGQGYVHGSLWPGNIMAAGEQLKLSVDGIRSVGEPSVVATTYDAPEVGQGVSPASDIWGLGVTLVEGLTQRRPEWTTGTSALQLPESLPQPFRTIAEQCLMREAGSRCSTATIRKLLAQKTTGMVAKPVPATPKASVPVPAVAALKAKPHRERTAKRYVLAGASIVIAVATVIAIPRLSERTPEPVKTETVAVPAPAPASKPVGEVKKPSAEVMAPDTVRHVQAGAERPASTPKEAHEPLEVSPLTNAARVERSSGNTRGQIVDQVMPNIPRKAMNTINGKFHVQVKVQVNREGNVAESEFTSAGPSRYFANLTMQAAKQWKFAPSQEQARAWNLNFEFRRSGASVKPVQIDR